MSVELCGKCKDGWVCEAHPDRSWPDECDCHPGMPCPCMKERQAMEQKPK